jgi:hypothetical protein
MLKLLIEACKKKTKAPAVLQALSKLNL